MDDTIVANGSRYPLLLEVAGELEAELAPHTPLAVADWIEAALRAYWSDPVRHKAARLGIAEARRRLISSAFAGAGGLGLPASLADRFADRFSNLRQERMRLFPGALEALIAIRARGVRMALVTNGASVIQRATIERFELEPHFDHVQIEGEHGFGKPEPAAYHHALGALGVAAQDAWMVGDNLEWEVAAPQRLGIQGVWCDHAGVGLPPDTQIRPDRIIRSLTDLI